MGGGQAEGDVFFFQKRIAPFVEKVVETFLADGENDVFFLVDFLIEEAKQIGVIGGAKAEVAGDEDDEVPLRLPIGFSVDRFLLSFRSEERPHG